MAILIRVALCAVSTLVLCTLAALPGQAQAPSLVPAQAEAGTNTAARSFDVHAAVQAYLAKMPPSQQARSNAYFKAATGCCCGFVTLVLAM